MTIYDYTPGQHHKRTEAVQNLVRIWCNARHLDYSNVQRISHLGTLDNGAWQFEVETVDRTPDGEVIWLVRDGQREISTTITRFTAPEPGWWPQERGVGSV